MKRENVKKNIGIISAFADGKTIQILNERGEWVDLTEREGLPIGILEEEPNNFRTKPEPKYRPFKDAEECWQEMLKHQPFGWVKCKEDGSLGLITLIISEENIFINGIGCNSERTMRGYTFADGTPFGILEEE
jgi:hypothetical protein